MYRNIKFSIWPFHGWLETTSPSKDRLHSEWAFSSGSLTRTKYHNCLNRVVFESLQLLIYKSAYHNGHLSTARDAKQHIDALIASFDDEEVDDKDLPELADAQPYIQIVYSLN